jgi:phage gp46-like protein
VDVAFTFPCEVDGCIDVSMSCGDLATGNDLSTAIAISLLTDRRALDSDVIPDGTDPRGWWGDAIDDLQWGSRLWLLERSRDLPETFALAAQYAKESLSWLVQDGIVESVNVTAQSANCGSAMFLCVYVKKPDGKKLSWRYRYLWDTRSVQSCEKQESWCV